MKFSIITVCYNSEKTIARTFESVLNQTFQDYEYIVVDGASTDGTLDIIKEYEPKFNGRMRYISEPDSGLYDAMNKGVRMSQGEIIGIINSDDYYEPDALQQVISHFISGTDVYYGILRCVDENGEILLQRYHHSRLGKYPLQHPASFTCKKTYEKFGLFDLQYRIAADYDLFFRFLRGGAKFVPIDKVLTNFSSGGISDITPAYEAFKVRFKYGIISRPRYWICLLVEFVRARILKW